MKKYLIHASLIVIFFALISWGVTGHRTIGRIAEAHLTDRARKAIKDLLQNQTLADVSTYADEVRSDEKYKYTAPWHYINLPLGLNYNDFEKQVLATTTDNVYKALIKCQKDLGSPNSTREQKIFALKFIVHLVGDLHQPMHVSRAEDKGGNSIQVTFNGKSGNLHGLWDSDLLEHKGLTYQQLAQQYDHATTDQINAWQHDAVITWMYESYQVSSQLYKDAASTPQFDEAYYQLHFPLITERLLKAAVRLAGLLNQAFSNDDYLQSAPAQKEVENSGFTRVVRIQSADAAKHIGETVSLTTKIFSSHLISSNNYLLLNAGAEYPDQHFTILIKPENAAKFKAGILQNLVGKSVVITGKVIDFRGKPEIEIEDPSQFNIL